MSAMDLFVSRAGPYRLAFAASQVARVAPCQPGVTWPPPADGVLGWTYAPAAPPLCIVDPVTLWHAAQPDGGQPAGTATRQPPPYLLVLHGETLALAVDSHTLGAYEVQQAPAVLRRRGVHALIPQDGGYAIVLDMSRIAQSWHVEEAQR